MDPKACLMRLDQAISDCEFDQAHIALDEYRQWRKRRGFEPAVYGKRGDAFMNECARRLHDAVAGSKKRRYSAMTKEALRVARTYTKVLARSARYRAQCEGAAADYCIDYGEWSGPASERAIEKLLEEIAAQVGSAYGWTGEQVYAAAMEYDHEQMYFMCHH